MRHHLRHPHPRLAVPAELVRAAHQAAGLLGSGEVRRHLIEVQLSVVFVEHRLRIEQVHLARTAVHEQLDDGLRLGPKMRRPGFEVVALLASRVGLAFRGRRAVKILAEECRQSDTVQSVTDVVKEAAPRQGALTWGSDVVCLLHGSQSIYRNAAEFNSVWLCFVRARKFALSTEGAPDESFLKASFSLFRANRWAPRSSALGGRPSAIQYRRSI